MRKRVILAFMLVFALVAASSCSLIIKDEEVDKQTPIIEVVGKTFTKAEVNEQVEAVMDYEEYMYSMYGISYDRRDASPISMTKDSANDAMVQQAVLEKKAADLGLDVLSDEEKAEVEESVDSTYTLYSDSVKSAYFADTELEGEELDAAVEAKMAELAYPTREELVESETNAKVLEKVRDEAVKDVTVSEEELQEAYNTDVESAMTTYGNSPSSYGTDVQNGATIYYVPAGYRYVKHILIEFTDEDSQAISDLESQISQKQTEPSTAETSLADLGEDASADDEATAQNRATLSEAVEALAAADGLSVGPPVHYASPAGALLAFLDRMFYAGAERFAHKPAAAFACARRAGTTASLDVINKYFTISQMPVVSSTYWSQIYGGAPGDASHDAEGLQTARNLARNMAWLLKCIAAGPEPPEAETAARTNFIR